MRFLVSFDDFCQEVVKELREEYPHIRRVYVRMYYPELGEPYIGYTQHIRVWSKFSLLKKINS